MDETHSGLFGAPGFGQLSKFCEMGYRARAAPSTLIPSLEYQALLVGLFPRSSVQKNSPRRKLCKKLRLEIGVWKGSDNYQRVQKVYHDMSVYT